MRNIYLLALCILLAGCSGVFDYHPYDARFSGETDINARNMERIERECGQKEEIVVAFISDSHGWYSDTKDMIDNINGRQDVDFVVHLGDITDCGTTKEFVWQRDILARLAKPYVVLIGNHDFLGTGEEVYYKMFGPGDFSFIAAGVKFVCLNTNATEYDYMAPIPNFDYMEQQMTERSDEFGRTVVCMHAPPFGDQFNNNVAKVFGYYLQSFPGLQCCVNGHDHRESDQTLYQAGIRFFGIDCASHRNYMLFKFTPDGYEYQTVSF